ncbi:acylneuraminate cytidylyltransferase [Candidatus Falkowbacteria bacterium CG10_big_fil_rev_8_21_14_0_10_43_10]|uniref:Acylneuraminate cytidylyltransferase n=1 Tax=Candidatus Falkowbacteria bacterium CG10_big_fil_rev_8_21_14_0_10_43_10 TaxID=1974567 RepID=A0A2H0V270_9BACT|nr:MAG: acylneuraminate cytidylyltransferase [Candidatus Falkowbacteria bacterium CG10_big_fil_rev_8_21_14_0_10_43_10]
MNIVAIIPARGGSKRFPGKNIYPLNGKPLISYPIESAKKAKLVDRVIVSTDDKEIASLAEKYGAEVFMRPAELATDQSPVIDTIVYTAEKLAEEGDRPDYILLLQAASPLIEPKQVDRAIKLALGKKADSVVAVSEVGNLNHPYNIREIMPDGMVRFWQYDLHYKDLGKPKPLFYKAANIWLSSYETLVKEHKLEGKRNYPIIIDEFYSLDIDYKEDLDFMEVLMQHKSIDKSKKS